MSRTKNQKLRTIAAIALLIGAGLNAGWWRLKNEEFKAVESMSALLDQGKVREASQGFESWQQSPAFRLLDFLKASNPQAVILAGEAYFKIGEYHRSGYLYEEAAARTRDPVRRSRSLFMAAKASEAASQQGSATKAIRLLVEAIEADHDYTEAKLELQHLLLSREANAKSKKEPRNSKAEPDPFGDEPGRGPEGRPDKDKIKR